ncbi:MAG: AI-2E family transporter [Actinomycetota bacterium]|nr:AI-2E family transporter [Actinomycetota bacterium]
MDEERGIGTVAYRAVLLAAGLLLFGILFHELVSLLLAILITVIVAIALSAVAERLERRQVPRAIGALIALVIGVGVIVGLFAVVIPSFIEQTNDFAEEVPAYIDDLSGQIGDLTGAQPTEIADRVQKFSQRYVDDPGLLIGPLASIGLGVAGVLAALVLILLTAYYMAINPAPLIDGLRRLVPPAYRPRADHIMRRLRSSWVGWMQGVAADMVISGLLLYLGLSIVGLDFAIFFAVLAALLVVIPYFGAIAGGIPPVLFAFTESPGKALLVMGIYVLVQQVEGNLTIPLVMSRTVKLHPAVIAVGVVVVGQLFGLLGLIVAVPILSLVVILVEELWVHPMEEADRLDEPGPMGVPPSSEVAETAASPAP